jgi:hypothetical protein
MADLKSPWPHAACSGLPVNVQYSSMPITA